MAKVKDLYIAKSMEDLNAICSFNFEKGRSIKSYLGMLNKTFQAAEDAFNNKDEERAYILYMRYGDAMMKVRKTKEYQKEAKHYSTLFGTTKLQTALQRAEKLSGVLRKRYSKLKESVKNPAENIKKSDFIIPTENGIKVVEEYVYPTESITSQELYRLLYKDKKHVIVMDIRSNEDYEDSHCIHQSFINIPKTAITPGSVTSKIEKGIPMNHINVWNSRSTVDLVVLLDWHSTAKELQDMSNPLRSLKDSIFKWDLEKELIREPVILEGGYAELLESFPQFTSNPHVIPPTNKPKTGKVNSLLDFNYADLRKNFASLDDNSSPASELSEMNQKHKENSVKMLQKNGIEVLQENGVAKPANISEEHKPINQLAETVDTALLETKNLSGLYPDFSDINLVSNKVPVTEPTSGNVSKKEKLPSFDRSTKPKIPQLSNGVTASKCSPTHHLVAPESLNNTITVPNTPPVKVDRSTKPKFKDKSSVDNQQIKVPSEQIEIRDLEESISEMKRDQEEKEKRLLELEEKKRLHLLSVRDQMKLKNEELAALELKAKNELAETMRLDKPKQKVPDENFVASTLDISKQPASIAQPNLLPLRKSVVPSVSAETPLDKIVKSDSEKSAASLPKQKPAEPSSLLNDLASKNIPSTLSDSSSHNDAPAVVTQSKKLSTDSASIPPVTPNIPFPECPNVKKPSLNSPESDPKVKVQTSVKEPTGLNSSPSVYHAPLKDEPDVPSVGLKRSFSSPNIAKMVQQKDDQTPSIPSRQIKPLPSQPVQVVPSRDAKPVSPDDQDPAMAGLNFSLRGVFGGEGITKCGLRNLGNSCYMNSVLQCMFNTTQLADYILSNSYRSDINRKTKFGSGGLVAESFAVLLRAVWSGQYRYLIPSDIKRISGNINDRFAGYNQEDSHEFLLFLIDGLHEDMNKVTNFTYKEIPDNNLLSDEEAAKQAWQHHKRRNESVMVELFNGQYKGSIRCLHCGKTSKTFDAFQFLTLSLPSRPTSLTELIKDFTKDEKLTGDNRWDCPRCKTKRDAVRTISLWKLPPVLIVHLKRFVYTGPWRDKIHTNISFPVSGLNLTSFTCGPKKRPSYDLYAVSVS